MLAKPFEKPVRVWVGLGFPRQLNNVADAYQMLMGWCGNSPEQKAAIRACKAALAGDVDAETARGIFSRIRAEEGHPCRGWGDAATRERRTRHAHLIGRNIFANSGLPTVFQQEASTMADDPNKQDGRDRSKVAGGQDYEVQHFAQANGITPDQTEN